MNFRTSFTAAVLALVAFASACSTQSPPTSATAQIPASPHESAHQQFFDALAQRCGNAFAGKLVSTDAADADMADEVMVMHISNCSVNEIRIPFHVGEDRSRTWVLTRNAQGVRLKHDHRHKDGSEDAITHYGGDTATDGTATRQEFPVDAESIALFSANDMQVSNTNVWAVEIDAKKFAYELRREGRFFRVEFDLTRPIPTPPPARGL